MLNNGFDHNNPFLLSIYLNGEIAAVSRELQPFTSTRIQFILHLHRQMLLSFIEKHMDSNELILCFLDRKNNKQSCLVVWYAEYL